MKTVRFLRLTLGARLLLVLLGVVTATTVLTLLLQDRSLQSDLERLARSRLQEASEVAEQLIQEALETQLERYEAIAATPQFQANVESRHVPTLSHFAQEIVEQQPETAVFFFDPQGKILAGNDPHGLAESAHRALASARTANGSAARSHTSLVEHHQRLYSLTSVPWGELEFAGALVCLEPVDLAQLEKWSKICRASLVVEPAVDTEALTLPIRDFGKRELQVATSLQAERKALANSRTNLLMAALVSVSLAAAVSVLLARHFVRPIRAIQSATERIAAGDFQFRLEVNRQDELGDVAQAWNLMLDGLNRNIRKRIRAEKKFQHLAQFDGLTGLANRRQMEETLTAWLEEEKAEAPGGSPLTSLAILHVDLDRFQDVHETFGHASGDSLLREVSRRFKTVVQEASSAPTLLARTESDEFVWVVPQISDRTQVDRLAQSLLSALEPSFAVEDQEIALGASLGIAMFPDDADDAETLLRYAAMAVAQAKNQGGNIYAFYTDSLPRIASKRLALENQLRRALEDQEFDLHYQPKVQLSTGKIAGFEALLRWHSPEHGFVNPAEFVPLAEETGAIVPIGEWALRQAVQQSLTWQEVGLPAVPISVNVSARQVEERADLVSFVADLLAESGLDPRLLDLEITESSLLRDQEGSVELFHRLRALGVTLSLDDFGTGYSSLAYLRQLPVDTLKVDRAFVPGTDSGDEDAKLIGSIIAMAKVLNLKVVVEGVETWKQRRFLEAMGCDQIQGYVFSEPVDGAGAEELLRKKRLTMRRKKAVKAEP